MTMSAAHARRVRPEPTYFYKSALARVDGDVRFGEGCVVLPYARISVSPGARLEIGPFTLIADFAELHVTTTASATMLTPSPAGAGVSAAATASGGGDERCRTAPSPSAATTLRISSHNHLHSYARVHFDLSSGSSDNSHGRSHASPFPACVELLGSGNVFYSFATVHVQMRVRASPAFTTINDPNADEQQTSPRAACPSRPWQVGDFNVFTTHCDVHLAAPDESQRPPPLVTAAAREEEKRHGLLLSPAPTLPTLGPECAAAAAAAADTQRGAVGGNDAVAEPSMPGRVSVEERLFQDPTSDEDTAEVLPSPQQPFPATASSSSSAPPSRTATASCVVAAPPNGSPVSPAAAALPSVAAPPQARVENTVYLSVDAAGVRRDGDDNGVVTAAALPRYGTRSVSELPTVIKRIIAEEKERRQQEEGRLPLQQQQQQPRPPTQAASPPTASPEPGSPVTEAAAAALADLGRYVDTVHPNLRAHTEENILAVVERLCRFHIHQYIADEDLYPVDTQYDDDRVSEWAA
jgi:hypothetical protein